MNWFDWKKRNRDLIGHVAGFEETFVDKILQNIPEIEPNDVIPQYHFKDSKGGNRFIDFMIINKSKGYCLPIELDGYAKMVGNGDEYYKFNDFLERQNSIINTYGLVLRYSNKKMFNQPNQIINEIREALMRQASNKSTEDIKQKQINNLVEDYESKLKQIKNKLMAIKKP